MTAVPTIPPLDGDGFLPVGLFECSLEELRERFGRFQRSDRRINLATNLTIYLRELRETGKVAWVCVDGSFVSAKEEPGDIDLIVVLATGAALPSPMNPFDYAALSSKRVKRRLGFDVFVAAEGTQALAGYLDFFAQRSDNSGRSKGLLKVRP